MAAVGDRAAGGPLPSPVSKPSPLRMIGRGVLKRCAVCGSGGLFTGWFRMKERCPRCGYLFEREECFFLGAYVINLAITQGLLLLLAIVPLIVLLNSRPDQSLTPILVGGLSAALVGPLVFYPFSKTIWTAIDLILRPVDAPEPPDRV